MKQHRRTDTEKRTEEKHENPVASQPASGSRLLGLWIDGNVVQIAEMGRIQSQGKFVLHGLAGYEDPDLFEIVDRIHDPVFLEVERSRYPSPGRLGEAVRRILDKLQPQTLKTVVCMAGESVRDVRAACEPGESARERVLRELLQNVRSDDPFGYPLYLTVHYEKECAAEGRDEVRVSITPFADVQGCLALMKSLPLDLLGLSNSRQALVSAARLFGEKNQDIFLLDVGRMRSHFVRSGKGRPATAIPVAIGLVRNETGVFRALPRRVTEAGQVVRDANRSPAGHANRGTESDPLHKKALKEYRHLAKTIGNRFSQLKQTGQWGGGQDRTARFLLSGLPSRIPGLRQALGSRAGIEFARPESVPVRDLEFDRERDRGRLGDFLAAAGAPLRVLGSPPSGQTAWPVVSVSINLKGTIPVAELEPGVVYEVDRPYRVV
jgi:hypothetical protein